LFSTGASRFAVAFYGQLPLRFKDLLTFGAYDFECAMRAAMIMGAVSAGGIGTELTGAINFLEYRRVTTLVILLVLLIAVFDRVTWLVRKYPRVLLLIVILGAYSAWDLKPNMLAFSHTFEVLARMWPPRLSLLQIQSLPALLGETLVIAFAGTAAALLLAVPLGAAAARNLSPAWLHGTARRILETLRAIPEVVWGLVLVSAAVMGWKAGTVALALHSTGVLGKLYAESIENVQWEPVMALASTGARGLAVAGFGHMPLAFSPMAIQTLFRLEWNIRAAAVVGMIGAGGIGQALYNAQQLFFYDQMLAYLLLTFLLVLVIDLGNSYLRRRWKVTEGLV
jgi:phosphonate transport system permease protein